MTQLKIVLDNNAHKINVETRSGTPIPNVQDRELPRERIQVAIDNASAQFPAPSKIVNGPSGYYNCVGLVFASRRSQIMDLSQLPRILAEDGYVEVNESDAQTGDVVTYAVDGVFEHVGLVVDTAVAPFGVPKILSKHGWSVEVVHLAHTGPYNAGRRQYFRVRNYDFT